MIRQGADWCPDEPFEPTRAFERLIRPDPGFPAWPFTLYLLLIFTLGLFETGLPFLGLFETGLPLLPFVAPGLLGLNLAGLLGLNLAGLLGLNLPGLLAERGRSLLDSDLGRLRSPLCGRPEPRLGAGRPGRARAMFTFWPRI